MTTPAALDHPDLHADPAPDATDAVGVVRSLGQRLRESRSDLDAAIRVAISAGATEKDVTEASGLARMTVRKVLGKVPGGSDGAADGSDDVDKPEAKEPVKKTTAATPKSKATRG